MMQLTTIVLMMVIMIALLGFCVLVSAVVVRRSTEAIFGPPCYQPEWAMPVEGLVIVVLTGLLFTTIVESLRFVIWSMGLGDIGRYLT